MTETKLINGITSKTDMILQTIFWDVSCNMDRKQYGYKATLNAIHSDLFYCLCEGSLYIPNIYVKMLGLGKVLGKAELIRLPKWKKGFPKEE
jgi:hypothetical protein